MNALKSDRGQPNARFDKVQERVNSQATEHLAFANADVYTTPGEARRSYAYSLARPDANMHMMSQ